MARKVLEQIEEALDQIAFTIECELHSRLMFRLVLGGMTGLRRTDRRHKLCRQSRPLGWRSRLTVRASKVMILAGRKHEFDKIAQSVDERMNFGRQSAARSAARLRAVFFRAPALCW